MSKTEREYRNFEVRALDQDAEQPQKIVKGYATTFGNPYTLYDDGEY
jgi:hypothetical protein